MRCLPKTIRRFPCIWKATALCVAVFAIVGCAGGSGSSGFDIAPFAEDRFILQALDERRCVDADGLPICPTDTDALALPAPLDQPGPALGDVSLATGFSEGAARCAVGVGDSALCALEVALVTGGVPAGANVQVAVRTIDPAGEAAGAWNLGAATVLAGDATVTTTVLVPVVYPRVQLAVLVFLDVAPLAAGSIERLADAEPDIAFVTDPLRIEAR